jgi:hypothetical protein
MKQHKKNDCMNSTTMVNPCSKQKAYYRTKQPIQGTHFKLCAKATKEFLPVP